jgi:hypothetical protein
VFCFVRLVLAVHNVSEAVKARVTKRLERAVMIPNSVKAQAAQQAGNMTSPKYVAQALAQTLCKKFPERMEKQGVTVEMEEVFREHTFVVLQLTIKHVNPLTMMTSAWTESGLSWLLEAMGPSNREQMEGSFCKFQTPWVGTIVSATVHYSHTHCLLPHYRAVPNMVTSLLAATVPKMLKEKMADKKIEAETKVLRSREQSIYFYKKLNELRSTDHWDQRFTLNAIKTIYKRMSSSSSVSNSTVGTALPEEDESLAATSASSSSWNFT